MRALRQGHGQSLRAQAGQATTEFIVVVVAVLIAVATVGAGAKYQCIKDMNGTLEDCESLPKALSAAFKSSVEEITFLINLPF